MTNAGGAAAKSRQRPDGGTPHLAVQEVEGPANHTMEVGGKGDRLESGQMHTLADL